MLYEPYKIFFETLANKTRFEIINFLKKSPKSVSEICEGLNINQTTVSHNLKRLKTCGFVKVENRGKNRIYSLNKKTILPLLRLMNMHVKDYCSKICVKR